jgi:hypothetical protein
MEQVFMPLLLASGKIEDFGRLAAQVLVSALAVPVELHTEEPMSWKNEAYSSPWTYTHAKSLGAAQRCCEFFYLHRFYVNNRFLKLSRIVSPGSIKSQVEAYIQGSMFEWTTRTTALHLSMTHLTIYLCVIRLMTWHSFPLLQQVLYHM